MQSKPTNAHGAHGSPPATLTPSDIYYVIFKHKWMILGFSAVGLIAAVALVLVSPPPYVSEAKLLIRYVEDSKTMTMPGADAQVRSVGFGGGEGVLQSEADIITSLDVAASAADAIGVAKVLGKNSAVTNREAAALAIRRGLTVRVPKQGNVLELSYKHSDVTLVQPILRKIIEGYYKKHVEIHKNLGVLDNFLSEETDRLTQSLRQTEEELRSLKTKAQVVSLDETRKVHADRYATLRRELDLAEADLSERVAALNEMQKANLSTAAALSSSTNGTNTLAQSRPKPPSAVISEYRRLNMRLEAATRQENEILARFSPDSPRAKEFRTTIAALEEKKQELETANPGLLDEQVSLSGNSNDRRGVDLMVETTRVAALQARAKTLNAQLEKVKADAGLVDDIETQYLALQRKKEQQELQYKYYSKSLDQARVDSQLGTGKLSNINEIQSPSVPLRDAKDLNKKVAVTAAGGVGLGLGLAFLLELVLNQAVRKPADVERQFDLPVFLTIPHLNGKKPKAIGANGAHVAPLPQLPSGTADEAHKAFGNDLAVADGRIGGVGEIEVWDEDHRMHPYAEALRDRLVTFFEIKGMTHKPKLVAVTSCSRGAGVTTMAAGLAASLSETGDGNVLLVDMNVEGGAAHPFFRGKPGLADLLAGGGRSAAQVQEQLFLVHGTGGDEALPKSLHKRLAHLLPKLHASDYDYIIFDMPPVTQTSVTPRLAGFMDMVFIVVDGDKTNREWLKHANQMLKQSKANIAAVFNKRREYVPRWLHHEF